MNFLRIVSAAIATLFLTTAITARGFVPAQLDVQAKNEAIVAASPNEAQATADELGLASYVHRMGTPGDLRSAKYVRDQLAAAGWDAQLVTYNVAISWPYEQRLTLLGKTSQNVDLYEPAVPGDPYSANHKAIGIPYSGYSVDGDVTGPVVYANHAAPEDFAALASMGVSVKNAIIIARPGGNALTMKAYEAAKHGAKAVLVFPDPLEGGYFKGETYPNGPWRPLGGAMRNTLTFTDDPGDPTAIGIPVPGAAHKPFSAIALPPIPEMPITGLVAKQVLASLGGPVGPAEWHPGFAFPLHLGGNVQAHFVIKSKRFYGPIWDVIATMPGVDTKHMVVVGSHRDAWTYGAVDPISGTVDLLQLGRAFGKLKASGWKPQRTIVIGSWDGEELNLFGSDEWVEQHAAELRAGCVGYINTDEVAFGSRFGAYATPDLSGMLLDAATAVNAPNGELLATYWKAQDKDMAVESIGGGSDHEPFVYHENIPAAGAGYGGPFGTYHSAYDDPASLRVFDPGMHEAAAIARYTSVVVLRLADATYPDLRLTQVAKALQKRIDAFAKVATGSDDARRAAVVAELKPDADAYLAAAQALDAKADAAITQGDSAAADATYEKLRASEDAFFQSDSPKWTRTLLYSVSGYAGTVLPSLDDTIGSNGDAALAKLNDAFKAAIAATR